jgi:hypothetical protein
MAPRSKPVIKEVKVETHLQKQTKALGGKYRKVRWIGRRGAPDDLVMFPRVACLVETKRPGEKARFNQVREHEALRWAGLRVEVASTIEEVDALLCKLVELSRRARTST